MLLVVIFFFSFYSAFSFYFFNFMLCCVIYSVILLIMSLAATRPVAAAVTIFPALPAPSPMKYILLLDSLKLLSVSISLLKNFTSGPYNNVSSLATPGIILSRVSSPSIMFVMIRCGRTSAKSLATQSFKVGSINPLFIRCHSLLRSLLKSFND